MEQITPTKISTWRIVATSLALLIPTVAMQFEKGVRREVGRRDRWTCQECGGQFREGIMVHAAHYPEHHGDKYDTNPENGRILCVRDHLKEHVEMFLEDPTPYNQGSLNLIASLAYREGYHTRAYYANHPEQRLADRDQVIQDLADYGICYGHMIEP